MSDKILKTFTRSELLNLERAPVIWVYPEELDHLHKANWSTHIDLSGDWDLYNKPFSKGMIYNSFKQRLEGVDWKDTEFYIFYNHQSNWPGLTKLDRWDLMIQDIVANGYTHRPIKDPIDNYIAILIGRTGRMIIYNGIHRYACCLLSTVKQKIPIKVLARHSQWQEFKDSCIKYQKIRKKIYSQLPHPDLALIPYHFTNERADIIAKHSNFPHGTVTDIGAHWGAISYTLAQHGFKVNAIEKEKSSFIKMKKISEFPGFSFTPINADFTTLTNDSDILVMLNIAHHFTPNPKPFLDFLYRSKQEEIFYQAHSLTDKWAKVISPQGYLKMLMDASSMTNAVELADLSGRKLWYLTN